MAHKSQLFYSSGCNLDCISQPTHRGMFDGGAGGGSGNIWTEIVQDSIKGFKWLPLNIW